MPYDRVTSAAFVQAALSSMVRTALPRPRPSTQCLRLVECLHPMARCARCCQLNPVAAHADLGHGGSHSVYPILRSYTVSSVSPLCCGRRALQPKNERRVDELEAHLQKCRAVAAAAGEALCSDVSTSVGAFLRLDMKSRRACTRKAIVSVGALHLCSVDCLSCNRRDCRCAMGRVGAAAGRSGLGSNPRPAGLPSPPFSVRTHAHMGTNHTWEAGRIPRSYFHFFRSARSIRTE